MWQKLANNVEKGTDTMQLNIRKLAPALLAMTLVLAGCKTMPNKTADNQPAAPAAGAVKAAPLVEFYIAQEESLPGLIEVRLPDGKKLYMQTPPVLTRDDLTEAAALVDGEGRHFVGLRFTESGTRKLNDVSVKSVGKMLALVIDRNLVAAPRIQEPLNRGVLAFSVPNEKAANDIAARIRGDGSVPAAPVAQPAAQPRPAVP